MKRALFLILLLASPLAAQDALLQNVAGTASNPGDPSPHVTSGNGPWRFFFSGAAHVTYASETGPETPRNETFSTNWLTAGLHRGGDRMELLVRGRVSLEPYTTDDGYPQILQYISPEAGDLLVDRMRPQDLIGEAAAQASFRIAGPTWFHLYAGLVGQPALGPLPYALRASGTEFAEAPFAYEVQETFQDATSVVTAGVGTRWLTFEASVFHDAVTTGDHTEIDSGDIDSSSARVTLRPTPNLAVQYSRGRLGESFERRDITSASLSWGTENAAASLLYTTRDDEAAGVSRDSFGAELTFRFARRNTLMVRAEMVERPVGFPELIFPNGEPESTTHVAVGYIFDVIATDRFRTGAGVNIDYHINTHDLEDRYGHKPQTIYAFVRVRTR